MSRGPECPPVRFGACGLPGGDNPSCRSARPRVAEVEGEDRWRRRATICLLPGKGDCGVQGGQLVLSGDGSGSKSAGRRRSHGGMMRSNSFSRGGVIRRDPSIDEHCRGRERDFSARDVLLNESTNRTMEPKEWSRVGLFQPHTREGAAGNPQDVLNRLASTYARPMPPRFAPRWLVMEIPLSRHHFIGTLTRCMLVRALKEGDLSGLKFCHLMIRPKATRYMTMCMGISCC